MIKTKRFFLIVLIIIPIFFGGISILYFADILSYSEFFSVQIGFWITTCNFLSGMISAKISIEKSEKTFIKIIFGSMIIRLLLFLSVILISLIFLDINRNSYIFSIFIFYIFYMIVEVFYLNLLKN